MSVELLDVLFTVTLLSLVLTGLPFLIHTKKGACTIEVTTKHFIDRVVPARMGDPILSFAMLTAFEGHKTMITMIENSYFNEIDAR